MREDDPQYWVKVVKLFDDGVKADGAAGNWNAEENPVEKLRWDNPDMYRGDNDDDEY
jgi:hypothetical protein